MDSNDSQISLKKETVPVYDYNCLLKFETPLKNTSFGRMLLSTESSSPNPVFGNSDRDTIKKEYLSKELCNSAMKGYFSPGYTADPTDKFSYKNSAKWSFTNKPKETYKLNPRYDFYERNDKDFNPAESLVKNILPSTNIKTFGLDKRFQSIPRDIPGPKYDLSKADTTKSLKYSLGRKLPNKEQTSSTPTYIGPGSYSTLNQNNLSKVKSIPKITFPKKKREELLNPCFDKHQTYSTKPALGNQIDSKKISAPIHKFGKETRESRKLFIKDQALPQRQKIFAPMPKI